MIKSQWKPNSSAVKFLWQKEACGSVSFVFLLLCHLQIFLNVAIFFHKATKYLPAARQVRYRSARWWIGARCGHNKADFLKPIFHLLIWKRKKMGREQPNSVTGGNLEQQKSCNRCGKENLLLLNKNNAGLTGLSGTIWSL